METAGEIGSLAVVVGDVGKLCELCVKNDFTTTNVGRKYYYT